MEINIRAWAVIALLGAVQGIILSFIVLASGKTKNKANRILALLIFLFSLRLAEFTAYWTPFFLNYPDFSFITTTFPFLYGPLLFFYVKRVSGSDKTFKRVVLLHFSPFIIHLLILLPYYFQSPDFKLTVLMNSIYTKNPIFSPRFFIVRSAQDIFMMVYAIMSLRIMGNHNKAGNNFIVIKKPFKLTWLKNFIIGFLLFVTLDFLNLVEILIFKYKFITEIDSILMLYSAALIYALGYFSMKKSIIISGEWGDNGSIKYEKSGLSNEMAEDYLKRLIQSMEVDRLFTKNDLNLTILSKELKIPQHQLSQVLNEKLNQNFFDFINRYRVKEAERLLCSKEYSNFTILAIAHESGFNNKVSFNSAFKKFTGLKPSQYRNANKFQSI